MAVFALFIRANFGLDAGVAGAIYSTFLGLVYFMPLGGDTLAMIAMLGALIFISVGTGLFKGNLQVMVGNLYDDPKYADKRDSAR